MLGSTIIMLGFFRHVLHSVAVLADGVLGWGLGGVSGVGVAVS